MRVKEKSTEHKHVNKREPRLSSGEQEARFRHLICHQTSNTGLLLCPGYFEKQSCCCCPFIQFSFVFMEVKGNCAEENNLQCVAVLRQLSSPVPRLLPLSPPSLRWSCRQLSSFPIEPAVPTAHHGFISTPRHPDIFLQQG